MAEPRRNYSSQTYKYSYNDVTYTYNVKPIASNVAAAKKDAGISGEDKKRILGAVVVLGALVICLIILQAFASNVAFKNSELRKTNDALISDIETLRIEIQSSNNIGIVEEKATRGLGMVYPEGSSLVDISDAKKTDGIAAGLKKRAFN